MPSWASLLAIDLAVQRHFLRPPKPASLHDFLSQQRYHRQLKLSVISGDGTAGQGAENWLFEISWLFYSKRHLG